MRRHIIIYVLLLFCSFGAFSQAKWNQRYQQYFDQYKDLAIEQMLRYHIPASITLAQGVLESGAGYSELTRKSNNHFGIKCHGWTGRTSYHDDDARNECFRAYDSAYDSYEDHSKFLSSSKRYQPLFSLKTTDYKGWAKGLKACGYATNPNYAQQLINVIQLYRLYEYDTAKNYSKFMEREAHFGHVMQHVVQEFNKNYYVVVKKGDTFQSIASDVNMSYKKLASYNELYSDAVLEEGTRVWLKKKRRNAPKEYRHRPHKVVAGESLYDISQQYGIRIKYLYKMNQLPADYVPQVGDELRVR